MTTLPCGGTKEQGTTPAVTVSIAKGPADTERDAGWFEYVTDEYALRDERSAIRLEVSEMKSAQRSSVAQIGRQ
jgi:hypothetical protein